MKQTMAAVAIVIGFPFGVVAFVISAIWAGWLVGWRSVAYAIGK